MSETLAHLAPVKRATAMPPSFWQNVMAAPWRYDLFTLLRRVDAQGGERYPLGRAPLPRFEPLRIGQKPSLGFAPSTLAEVRQRDQSSLYDVSILSFGLFGPNGPLPLHLTEYARERLDHHQDESLTAFADLFHHRLTLLFYRAWADAQPTVSLDRADNKRFERYIASLIGMGQPGQLEKGSLSPHARFALAGHLTRNGRDPEGLEKILRAYFNVPVKVVTNIPQWMPLGERERARLQGGRRAPRLGESAFLGAAVRDVAHNFRIELGPLDAETYRHFLPGEDWVTRLRDWVRQYLGIEYQWSLRVLLQSQDVTGAALGGSGRLGYSAWLGMQPQPLARGDLVFSPER
ncbi:type VI secretion system baseplate subunit TssG [Phytobacter ursingii]|uniref:type VI secretion system baseplate subunit TssG n=1 Tax=Phytobacter ursingii TaxID=1972431 RepID=UPI000CD25233|nr:type VI secretion system baseplate subunit TssG [Enterobacteriaceae bacterium ENNIH1]RDT52545.1 type VI secretion system baseplate subunit TssG [Escherichia coli]